MLKLQVYFLLSFKEGTVLKLLKSWTEKSISNQIKKNLIFLKVIREVERQYKINNITYSKIRRKKKKGGNVEKEEGRETCK